MGKHSKETTIKKRTIIYMIIILLVLCLSIYFTFNFLKSNINNPETPEMHSEHIFSNATHLTSSNITLNVENGSSKINGTVFNNSDELIENLNCFYSLTDASGNIIYEFDINIAKLEPNSSSSFVYVSMLDLSNVANYTVDIIY